MRSRRCIPDCESCEAGVRCLDCVRLELAERQAQRRRRALRYARAIEAGDDRRYVVMDGRDRLPFLLIPDRYRDLHEAKCEAGVFFPRSAAVFELIDGEWRRARARDESPARAGRRRTRGREPWARPYDMHVDSIELKLAAIAREIPLDLRAADAIVQALRDRDVDEAKAKLGALGDGPTQKAMWRLVWGLVDRVFAGDFVSSVLETAEEIQAVERRMAGVRA